MNKIIIYILVFIGFSLFLQGCVPFPKDVKASGHSLEIYPEYQNVAVPYNIAPLNFLLRNEGVDAICVRIKGLSDSLIISNRGNKVTFPLKSWHSLLKKEKGHLLKVTVIARVNGDWLQYPSFEWRIIGEPLDAYISYRLIEPGYEVWNKLQIRERCIENFKETVIADNNLADGQCMNCHIYGGNNGDLSLFHIRGKSGGTILNSKGILRKLNLKTDRMISPAIYGSIHPSGRLGVFSTNIIIPAFHTLANRRLEVYDTVSDLVVADFDNNRIITSPLVTQTESLETFPTFSSDGRWVYFCSALKVNLPDSIKNLRYSLCRISFDQKKMKWGNSIDTIWNARLMKHSVCFPKVSPDGRFILYTVADYGTFPIWHRETDLQMMDLNTRQINDLRTVNSDRSDTYHSWSSNSHWFAFASKRGDGQYGRIYFAYIDSKGKVYKPFVLPQSDPENDDLNLKSYNIPELTRTPVQFNAMDIERIVKKSNVENFKE
jgi:hypothetical protein